MIAAAMEQLREELAALIKRNWDMFEEVTRLRFEVIYWTARAQSAERTVNGLEDQCGVTRTNFL